MEEHASSPRKGLVRRFVTSLIETVRGNRDYELRKEELESRIKELRMEELEMEELKSRIKELRMEELEMEEPKGVKDDSIIFEFEGEYYLLKDFGPGLGLIVKGRMQPELNYSNITVYSPTSRQVATRVLDDWYRRNFDLARKLKLAS